MLKKGNRLMDIKFPEKTLAIMVKRDAGFFVPTGKTVLKESDKILVITDNSEQLEKALNIPSETISENSL